MQSGQVTRDTGRKDLGKWRTRQHSQRPMTSQRQAQALRTADKQALMNILSGDRMCRAERFLAAGIANDTMR